MGTLSAGDALQPMQFGQTTLHRGLQAVIPTEHYRQHIQPLVDAGKHAEAADAVLHHVVNFQETRPTWVASGRTGGVGQHWSVRRKSNVGGQRATGADRFAPSTVQRSSGPAFHDMPAYDDVHVPVLLRGVAKADAVDPAPAKHLATFDHSIEGEVTLRNGASVNLRSAHVRLPEQVPETSEPFEGSGFRDGIVPGHVVVRRMRRDVRA